MHYFPDPAYPMGTRRNCLIADFKNGMCMGETAVLAGRLLKWEKVKAGGRAARLVDASGTLEIVLGNPYLLQNAASENLIRVGDIVEIQFERVEGDFRVHSLRRLVPFQGGFSRSTENVPNWKKAVFSEETRQLFQKRSQIIQKIRAFFLSQGFLEIDAPTLVQAPGQEPHLEPFRTRYKTGNRQKVLYLQTSPELTMKKWLAAGFEKIFYLGHSFRNEPSSNLHQPEFMMLEWYRAYAEYTSLMRDCEELVRFLARELLGTERLAFQGKSMDFSQAFERLSVADALGRYAGIDPASLKNGNQFAEVARQKGYSGVDASWSWDDIFFEIFLNEIEPHLGHPVPTFLTDYPVSMGALARRKPEAPHLVDRFELYVAGIELANAFTELNDPHEQMARFKEERATRRKLGRPLYPIDKEFLTALRTGMPPSAGIALGVDRLILILLDQKSLATIQF